MRIPSRVRPRAFTLIELLVVIAIIAILAAILFPVFSRAKIAAQATAGLSNIHQMNLSVALYQTDAEDTFPLAAYASGETVTLWHDTLDPYVKNKDVWHCPGSQIKVTDLTGVITSHWGYNARGLTDIELDFSNVDGHRAATASALASPAESVVFTSGKASVLDSWCGDDGKFLLLPSDGSGDCWGVPDPVHFDRAILAWADGHANRQPLARFYRGQDPEDRYFDRE